MRRFGGWISETKYPDLGFSLKNGHYQHDEESER